MKPCPACGRALPEINRYCTHCGAGGHPMSERRHRRRPALRKRSSSISRFSLRHGHRLVCVSRHAAVETPRHNQPSSAFHFILSPPRPEAIVVGCCSRSSSPRRRSRGCTCRSCFARNRESIQGERQALGKAARLHKFVQLHGMRTIATVAKDLHRTGTAGGDDHALPTPYGIAGKPNRASSSGTGIGALPESAP